jgi:hypothetical protein
VLAGCVRSLATRKQPRTGNPALEDRFDLDFGGVAFVVEWFVIFMCRMSKALVCSEVLRARLQAK